jgi:hypothetical protein
MHKKQIKRMAFEKQLVMKPVGLIPPTEEGVRPSLETLQIHRTKMNKTRWIVSPINTPQPGDWTGRFHEHFRFIQPSEKGLVLTLE